MSSIAQVSDALRQVLTTRAKERERETGFVERSTAQLDGPTFVQTTVFGWLDNPEASYAQLRHVAASLGVPVSSQAVEQRFGAESATLLREVLQEAVGEVLSSEASAPELLSRFKGVYVQDGTIISLPAALGDEWRLCVGARLARDSPVSRSDALGAVRACPAAPAHPPHRPSALPGTTPDPSTARTHR